MSATAHIRGDGFELTIRADRYEHPAEATGWDANWVKADLELRCRRLASFDAAFELTLRTEELEAFRDELRVLDRDLTGEATLRHREDDVGVTIRLERGKGTVSGYLQEHLRARLEFEQVQTDQSHVRQTLTELEAVVRAFPVRGDPYE